MLQRIIELVRRLKIVLIGGIIVGGVIFLYSSLNPPKTYIATAHILLESEIFSSIPLQELNIMHYGYGHYLDLQTHHYILSSDTMAAMAAGRLNNTLSHEAIKRGLSVRYDESSGQFKEKLVISFSHHDPQTAQRALDAVCASYLSFVNDQYRATRKKLLQKLSSNIKRLERELREKEDAIRLIKEKYGALDYQTRAQIAGDKMLDAEEALQETRLSLIEAQKQIGALSSQLTMRTDSQKTREVRQNIIQDRLSELELELHTLSSRYTPDHYKIKTMKRQIERLRAALKQKRTGGKTTEYYEKDALRSSISRDIIKRTVSRTALEARSKAQKKIAEEYDETVVELHEFEQKFNRLDKEAQSILDIINELKSKYELAKISKEFSTTVQVIDHPRTVRESVLVNPAMQWFLTVFALVLVIGSAWHFIDTMAARTKVPEDVQRALSIPMLAVVPFSKTIDRFTIDNNDASDTVLESFGILRTNLKHSSPFQRGRTCMIGSSLKGEGKTSVAAHIALSFALDGKRSIVVDCDLHRPSLHSLFFLQRSNGLSEYLTGNTSLENIITKTDFKNLSCITAGDELDGHADLLGGNRFVSMIEQLRSRAEYLFFDVPPVIPVSDALAIGASIGHYILVVRCSRTPVRAAKQAVAMLSRAGCMSLGFVFNAASRNEKYYTRYYGK
jgi:capsular exopolysaccharide synthesis family protein